METIRLNLSIGNLFAILDRFFDKVELPYGLENPLRKKLGHLILTYHQDLDLGLDGFNITVSCRSFKGLVFFNTEKGLKDALQKGLKAAYNEMSIDQILDKEEIPQEKINKIARKLLDILWAHTPPTEDLMKWEYSRMDIDEHRGWIHNRK